MQVILQKTLHYNFKEVQCVHKKNVKNKTFFVASKKRKTYNHKIIIKEKRTVRTILKVQLYFKEIILDLK